MNSGWLRPALYGLLLLAPLNAPAAVELPRLFSDGMVLQRNNDIPVQGKAAPGENVRIDFNGQSHAAVADKHGRWRIELPAMPAGGPYTMTVSGENTLTVDRVMVGDVWLASGQSNMEISMRRVRPLYEEQIQSADQAQIRYFEVPDRYNFKHPRQDLDGGEWKTTTPENVLDFSAVGYFFARELNAEYAIPVGIVNAAVGGSPVQAWLSEEALKTFPAYYDEARRFRDDKLIERIETDDQRRIDSWYQTLNDKDRGLKDGRTIWSGDLDTGDWNTMDVPGYLHGDNGVVWFRTTVEVPDALAGRPAQLNLGRLVDADTAFVNGTETGSTGYRYPPRRYRVPEKVLRSGVNTITVRVVSERGRSGFVPDKDYELIIGERRFDLSGQWRYRRGASMPALEQRTFVRWKPLGLYNAMIAPLTDFPLTGVIWYQGESNVSKPGEYRDLFTRLIKDWREQWDRQLPFLYVQLANFVEPDPEAPAENWALLREAQLQSLSVPDTAMAVTIDIGEWNDIHPLNKKDVGERLAAAAHHVAYGRDTVYSGPIYEGMKREQDRLVLSFKHVGGGLKAGGDGPLQGFTIAGPDRRFVPARARIRGDRVVVHSDKVAEPVAVRYAWTDNPSEANLYNADGFPASPFRTHAW